MTLQAVAVAIDTAGKLLVSFTALKVHHRVLREHKVDDRVFSEMRREQAVGMVGVVLIVIGSSLEMLIASGMLAT